MLQKSLEWMRREPRVVLLYFIGLLPTAFALTAFFTLQDYFIYLSENKLDLLGLVFSLLVFYYSMDAVIPTMIGAIIIRNIQGKKLTLGEAFLEASQYFSLNLKLLNPIYGWKALRLGDNKYATALWRPSLIGFSFVNSFALIKGERDAEKAILGTGEVLAKYFKGRAPSRSVRVNPFLFSLFSVVFALVVMYVVGVKNPFLYLGGLVLIWILATFTEKLIQLENHFQFYEAMVIALQPSQSADKISNALTSIGLIPVDDSKAFW